RRRHYHRLLGRPERHDRPQRLPCPVDRRHHPVRQRYAHRSGPWQCRDHPEYSLRRSRPDQPHRVVTAADPEVSGPRRWLAVSALGLCQLIAFGTSLYLLTVLAAVIVRDTHWPLGWVVGGYSLGVLISAVVAPIAGRYIG